LAIRLRVVVFLPVVVALAAVCVAASLGAIGGVNEASNVPVSKAALGKTLYRTYCGQCHALAAAGSVSGDLGANGGPTLTDLYVPFNLAIVAVTGERGPRGHEIAVSHMTWTQLYDVADFLAAATSSNPHTVSQVPG
jgi:mono/diheme cytochrome c family protein